MNEKYTDSLERLRIYIEKQNFKGYDPYDTLNSWIPFQTLGEWPAVLATQFQKRNPVNIRPFLGIKKFHSTKGMGLLLKAYLKCFNVTGDKQLIPSIEFIKNWLVTKKTFYNNDFCWGYDYPYSTLNEQLKKGFPTVIHHSYIIDGLYEYHKVFNDSEIKELIIESTGFIMNNIPKLKIGKDICFGYNPDSDVCCYNASLHAAKCLAIADKLNRSSKFSTIIKQAVDFVVSLQKQNGVWYYSLDSKGNERKQIDFHQGFILESIFDIKKITKSTCNEWENAIRLGLNFYKEEQFFSNGRSKWRLPKIYPVDIHNQSQGIITFTKLCEYNPKYLDFARTITEWTIQNMQSHKGYFYYRNYKFYNNRISYMRWSQAWMMQALSELIEKSNSFS